MLEKLVHKVDVVANGQEAVAPNALLQYDATLMDMQTPILDGIGTTKEIRGSEKADKHVTITANAMESDRQNCWDAGMDALLSMRLGRAGLISV